MSATYPLVIYFQFEEIRFNISIANSSIPNSSIANIAITQFTFYELCKLSPSIFNAYSFNFDCTIDLLIFQKIFQMGMGLMIMDL